MFVQLGLEIILRQHNLGACMIRSDRNDLLIQGDGVAPVFFLFLDLREQEMGFCVLWIKFEDISKSDPRFRIVACLNELLSSQEIFGLPLLRPPTSKE